MHLTAALKVIVFSALAWLVVRRSALADVLFVDNRRGSDQFNGLISEPIDTRAGPVATIQQALKRATSGDTIVVVNTGVPYVGPLQMVGADHSGNAAAPFTILGNGAVVVGTRPVPPAAWQEVGADLWKLNTWRKGWYQLVVDDGIVSEHPSVSSSRPLPPIPDGHWCAWCGAIYLKTAPFDDPTRKAYAFAAEDVGLTLYGVRHVVIQDLTFRHFRLDGVNAHDLCDAIELSRVKCLGNGRAGLAVGGSSQVVVRNSELLENRQHSLLVTEMGNVQLDAVKLDAPPTVVP